MPWTLLEQVLQALASRYTPAMKSAASAMGVESGWALLMAARRLEPEPTSAARLLMRNPYWTEAVYQDRLSSLARQGLLAPSARRSFRLSDQGRMVVQVVYQAAYRVLAGLDLLPGADQIRLAGLLARLVTATNDAPQPARKWALEHSQRDDPGPGAPAMVRIDQYLSDLAAFRDDCHTSTWRHHGITGPAWEAFTALWRGQAASLDELNGALARRSAPAGTYEEALRMLERKGWITMEAGRIRLTPTGVALRQGSEQETDSLFYQPWASLSAVERAEVEQHLASLLAKLNSK